jgi:methanogenic corrinoid protein MtbC1
MGEDPRASPDGALAAYLACLERGDATAALDIAIPLVSGAAGLEWVLDLLAAAQREVGRRWQHGEWTVAGEHAATTITERVTAALAAAVTQPAEHPPLVVVCAEGEWHTLPPLLLAEALRVRRWDVRFLGGSVPVHDLRAHLDAVRPLALGVSCTVPRFLGGALGAIAAGHGAGVPVVAGGRAFGASPLRAAALGADAWALDASAAETVLQHWADDGVRGFASCDPAALAGARQLLAEQHRLVAAACEALAADPSPVGGGPVGRRRVRDELAELVEVLGGAILTDDPAVVVDHLGWMAQVHAVRGWSAGALGGVAGHLTAALARAGFPQAAELLERAVVPAVSSPRT